ncbi:outer membrane beta-barrel protein [Aestuariivivens sediminis]|uniref:outer membrane beta-barrel protein n=1 Tax=Aestuariivivens sediminis TaxID=2913557 RepID=UPI001F57EEE5|nr:outer membrane beta-barrel protein [Aestuariivivens sediminis]
MTSNFKWYKFNFFVLHCILFVNTGFTQDTSTFKAQVALGLNNPSRDGFVMGYEGQRYNFPTVNLGLQYMFKPRLGAKADYGFSRMSNQDDAQEFKLNYSRINIQLVYDASGNLGFLPSRMGAFFHIGPGISIVKPLGNYTQNNTSYFNAMAGLEVHYGVSDKLSMFVDVSYINGFSKDFEPELNGFGSFNGHVLTLTLGASISLSGCYYCE